MLFIFYIDNLEFRQDSLNFLNNFPYPLIIDNDNKFIEINSLPDDKRFHTMLLDKQNKAILFGDPTFSKDIRELYIKQISKIK